MDPIRGNAAGALGVETSAAGNGGSMSAAAAKHVRRAGHILRLMVISLTCIAAFVMGFSNQQFTNINIKIKSTQSSAFVYFIVANVLVCVYSAVAIGPSCKHSSYSGTDLRLAKMDILAISILFTSNAAAMALDVVAWNGVSHYGWDKICNVAHNFCVHVSTAIVLSSAAGVAGILLLVLSIVLMHKRSPQ